MSDLSWWERHLGNAVRQAPPAPAISGGKAVRWEPEYPPTGPGQKVVGGPQSGGNGELSPHDRVQNQGFITKAPQSMGQSGECPGCGGPNFFRRKWAYKECAPLCVDCGYNGDIFTQSGTLLNAVGMRSSGPTAFARTDNPNGESHFGTDPSLQKTDFSWSSIT